MKAISLIVLFLALLSPLLAQDASVLVYRPTERVTRDFDDMMEVRVVRVLVAHSMTNFFIDAGRPRGFEYEMMQEYEKYLNKDRPNKELRIDVVYIPLLFTDLLKALNEGIGDIVAANMTVTPEREKLAAFTDPYRDNVSEIVVASKTATPLSSLDDLAGLKVFVKPNSSYGLHLERLNETFAKKGLKPVKIVHPSENLDTEDILELAHAGIIDYTVADKPIAELWSQNFPDLKLYNELKVNEGGKIAWAVRKDNPKLLASLNGFVKEHRKGTLLGNIFFRRYFENTKWILNPMAEAHQKNLEKLRGFFEKYGKQYGFDWVLMAAQGFQESGLDQSVVSRSGAIGIMQLLPSTAEYMGIANIDNEENNIQAGVKYMNYLKDKFFNDPGIDAAAKIDFTLAGYNAGPNRVERWRKKAKAQGLDPNKWFFNVERIALQEIGTETVRYVGNINKYYIAYKLLLSLRAERQADLEALEGRG
jgi:membrane-bound lytic murein transglycosylase MltF